MSDLDLTAFEREVVKAMRDGPAEFPSEISQRSTFSLGMVSVEADRGSKMIRYDFDVHATVVADD